MNCEICAEKFTLLKDLIRHGLNEHKYTHFFCTSCDLQFDSVTDVVLHGSTDEHIITSLATGIRFDTEDKSDTFSSFPPHTYCIACGYRGFLPLEIHIQKEDHKYMVWLIRTIIRDKKMHNFDSDIKTQEFISKLINLKQEEFLSGKQTKILHGPLPFICELCNIHFAEPQYYTQHLENHCHRRMEQFMIKLSAIVKEVKIIENGPRTKVWKTFSNSFPPLYYCEICCIWIDTDFNYLQHRRSGRHKTVELIKSKNINDVVTSRKTAAASAERFILSSINLKKRKVPSEIEEIKNSEQNRQKDCNGKKPSKIMKVYPLLRYKHLYDTVGKKMGNEVPNVNEENDVCRVSTEVNREFILSDGEKVIDLVSSESGSEMVNDDIEENICFSSAEIDAKSSLTDGVEVIKVEEIHKVLNSDKSNICARATESIPKCGEAEKGEKASKIIDIYPSMQYSHLYDRVGGNKLEKKIVNFNKEQNNYLSTSTNDKVTELVSNHFSSKVEDGDKQKSVSCVSTEIDGQSVSLNGFEANEINSEIKESQNNNELIIEQLNGDKDKNASCKSFEINSKSPLSEVYEIELISNPSARKAVNSDKQKIVYCRKGKINGKYSSTDSVEVIEVNSEKGERPSNNPCVSEILNGAKNKSLCCKAPEIYSKPATDTVKAIGVNSEIGEHSNYYPLVSEMLNRAKDKTLSCKAPEIYAKSAADTVRAIGVNSEFGERSDNDSLASEMINSVKDKSPYCKAPDIYSKYDALKASRTDSSASQFGDSDSSEDSEADNDSVGHEYHCKVCDFFSYSSLHYKRHFFGKHHKIMKRVMHKKEETNCTNIKQKGATSGSPPLQ